MSTPSLPQNDTSAERRERKKALEDARENYTYNYTFLPPLAMAQTPLPKGQRLPTVGWILTVIPPVFDLLDNLLALLDGHPDSSITHKLAPLHELRRKELQALKKDAERLAKRIDADTVSDQNRGAREGAFGRLVDKVVDAAEGVEEAAFSTLLSALWRDVEVIIKWVLEAYLEAHHLYGRAQTIEDFNKQYVTIDVPKLGTRLPPEFQGPYTFQNDDMFAYFRVGGQNPVLIKRIDAPPAKFPITEAQYQSVMGAGDSLARAGAEDRLYFVDWEALDGVVWGQYPKDTQKYVQAPMALFALPDDGSKWLKSVAIQCNQRPEQSNPIFTPDDGWNWQAAKLICQNADGVYSDFLHHLGMAHLLVEAFVMATWRQLAPTHPLHVLLVPHFEVTLWTNNVAQAEQNQYDNPLNITQNIVGGTIPAVLALAGNAVRHQDINEWLLPKRFARAGTDNPVKLQVYPYRDAGLQIWSAVRDWVSGYLGLYYTSDQDVQQDKELQAWVKEVEADDGGRLYNVGQDGEMRTFEHLVDIVTLVVYSSSAEHAAVNFPLGQVELYAPAQAHATYAMPPRTTEPWTREQYFSVFPPLETTIQQQLLGYLVGNTNWSKLGHYGLRYFKDPAVKPLLKAFQADLGEVEDKLTAYNDDLPLPYSRLPYVWLLPSRVPQSINI